MRVFYYSHLSARSLRVKSGKDGRRTEWTIVYRGAATSFMGHVYHEVKYVTYPKERPHFPAVLRIQDLV